jgi:ribonuclease HI
MFEFEELVSIAYKKERALSRRLSKGAALTEHEALVRVLRKSAGPGTLDELVDARRLEQQKAQAAWLARAHRKTAARAARTRLHSAIDAHAWHAWFDGSAHPNPGRIGIGGVLKGPLGEVIEISTTAGDGDSCKAEYLALIAVLDAALDCKPARLVIHGDSQIVIGDVSLEEGAPSLSAYAREARRLISRLGEVELRWIPRARNSAADALSQRAISAISAGASGNNQNSSRTSATGTCPNASLSA